MNPTTETSIHDRPTISYTDLVQSWDDAKAHLEHIRQAHLGKAPFPCPVCDAHYNKDFETTLDCIHQVSMGEFCQACEDRSRHIAQIEHERLFGYDYA